MENIIIYIYIYLRNNLGLSVSFISVSKREIEEQENISIYIYIIIIYSIVIYRLSHYIERDSFDNDGKIFYAKTSDFSIAGISDRRET